MAAPSAVERDLRTPQGAARARPPFAAARKVRPSIFAVPFMFLSVTGKTAFCGLGCIVSTKTKSAHRGGRGAHWSGVEAWKTLGPTQAADFILRPTAAREPSGTVSNNAVEAVSGTLCRKPRISPPGLNVVWTLR